MVTVVAGAITEEGIVVVQDCVSISDIIMCLFPYSRVVVYPKLTGDG